MFKYFLKFLIILALVLPSATFAFIDGLPAEDLIGQYDGTSYTDPQVIWTKGGANDGPNIFGFNFPSDMLIDSTNHRLFLAEANNNRVLVFNLNTDNTLQDKFPDYVLGQPDFYSNSVNVTQNGMSSPQGLAYDSVLNRLFVA